MNPDRAKLRALRARYTPLGWVVLHDPFHQRWYAVRGQTITADSPEELYALLQQRNG